MILISLYDFESVRYNLQSVNFSILKAYVPIFRLKDCFSKPIDMVPGDNSEKELSSLNIVYPLIYDAPVFWLAIIAFFVSFIFLCGITLFKFRNIIFKSMFTSIYSFFDVEYDEGNTSQDCVALIKRKYDVYIPENTYSNPFFYTIHILGFLFLFFCLCYIYTPISKRGSDNTLFPSSVNFLFGFFHFDAMINSNLNISNITRSYLPKGRYWIDTRQDPIYPLVHGDIDAFCAYNNDDPKCLNRTTIKDDKQSNQIDENDVPNVAFLIYESFNPFSHLIDNDFLDEHSLLGPSNSKYYVTDTPYYSKDIMPNLHRYASEGITFSGLASFGLPTLSGLHSIFTGLFPSKKLYEYC